MHFACVTQYTPDVVLAMGGWFCYTITLKFVFKLPLFHIFKEYLTFMLKLVLKSTFLPLFLYCMFKLFWFYDKVNLDFSFELMQMRSK